MTTALMDADILVMQSASQGEQEFEFADGPVTSVDLDQAIHNLERRIDSCMEAAGADRAVFALSDHGRRYFRHDLYPEYKAHRASAKVLTLRPEIRAYVEENHKTVTRPRLEADDVLGIMQTKRGDGTTVIVSTDKDMLQVPGHHLNIDDLDGGVFEVAREAGDLWHLVQTLTGDSTDGYGGCPRIGPKKAPPIAEAGWDAVEQAFLDKGLSAEDALVQARLAKILQVEDWDTTKQEVILWEP